MKRASLSSGSNGYIIVDPMAIAIGDLDHPTTHLIATGGNVTSICSIEWIHWKQCNIHLFH